MLTNSSAESHPCMRHCASVLTAALVVLFTLPGRTADAQSTLADAVPIETAKESNIKAVYLYSFARFTGWESFGSRTQSVFTIGVVGNSGVSSSLEKIAAKRKIHDKPIRVIQYDSSAEVGIDDCDLLFLTRSVSEADAKDLLARLRSTSVLTVTETASRPPGTVVNFVAEGSGIIFEINIEEAKSKRLALDARLLRQGKRMLPTQPTQGL